MNILLSRRFLIASLVFLVSLAIFLAGYNQENSEAYLFPIIVGLAMAIFSLISLIREAFALCIEDFQEFPFKRQLPVIVVMVAGISLVEVLGMFSTTFLVLLIVSFWYSPIEENRKRFVRSLVFSGGFSLAMYMLFSVMLNVQLPRGLIF